MRAVPALECPPCTPAMWAMRALTGLLKKRSRSGPVTTLRSWAAASAEEEGRDAVEGCWRATPRPSGKANRAGR